MFLIILNILIYILNNALMDECKAFNNSLVNKINYKLYILNDFDYNNNICIRNIEFYYNSNDSLEHIQFNQDNFKNKIALAVKNNNTLIILYYENNQNKFNEFLINVRIINFIKTRIIKKIITNFFSFNQNFDSKIILMEPKWVFNRVYIATMSDDRFIKIYEIDLIYAKFSLITSFFMKDSMSSLKLVADPLQG